MPVAAGVVERRFFPNVIENQRHADACSKIAGWLLVPYLAWVTFAAVLNFAIWRLNVA
jgi:tryptophan-rich sensory protein